MTDALVPDHKIIRLTANWPGDAEKMPKAGQLVRIDGRDLKRVWSSMANGGWQQPIDKLEFERHPPLTWRDFPALADFYFNGHAELPNLKAAENADSFLDTIACGGGLAALEVSSHNGITFAREVIRDHRRLPDWMLARFGIHASSLACFPAQGESMAPTIADGQVVFIDTRHRVPSPPGIYALSDEFGGVVLKRLEVISRPGDDDISLRISSDNPRHATRELLLSEIAIIGRYIGRFTI